MEQAGQFLWVWITTSIVWLLPFAALFAGLSLWKKRSNRFPVLASVLTCVSAVLSWVLAILLRSEESLYYSVTWWSTGAHTFDVSLVLSASSRLLLVIVTTVSALVNVYSIEYMQADSGKNRYFALLGLFTFSMLGIVLSDSLLLMFCFWELVGASSYFLIGFWFTKPAAARASFKAFMVNRIGDLGFIIGLGLVFIMFQSFNIRDIQAIVDTIQWKGEEFTFYTGESLFSASPIMFTVLGTCLLGGAVGKSAQFPLQVWLPDAMQGPTPVSALIHAATMVAAGIFFLARIYFLFTPDVLTLIAIVGAMTAFMGAVAAIAQNDIKKVLAFSTISQLGFMVMAVGVGGREAALFHLTTHAAFKAALFLAAGSIIHAMHLYAHQAKVEFDVQDIRMMGNLRQYMPTTFFAFLIAALALAGVPFFSGFLSKDAIITHAVAWASAAGGWRWLVPMAAIFTAFLTAFYMARVVIQVFFGTSKTPGIVPASVAEAAPASAPAAFIKENNKLITLPLMLLAAASMWIWFALNPFTGNSWLMESLSVGGATLSSLYLEKTSEVSHSSVVTISILVSLAGIFLGYIVYDEDTSEIPKKVDDAQKRVADKRGFFSSLSFNSWYLDELYDQTVVYLFWKVKDIAYWIEEKIMHPVVNYIGVVGVVFALMVGWVDKYLLDGLVNLAAGVTKFFGNIARSFQGGAVQKYIAWSLFFTLLLVAWILIK